MTKEIGGHFSATIDGNYGGEHSTLKRAQTWAAEKVRELLGGKTKAEVPNPSWAESFAQATAAEESPEALDVEWAARVGKKAAVLRQSSPGKWCGKIGGLPYATDLPLAEARRLCVAELLTGNPAGDGLAPESVVWERSEPFGGSAAQA